MLGEPDGTTSSRIRRLQHVLDGAGFPTLISADIGAWLLGHARKPFGNWDSLSMPMTEHPFIAITPVIR